MYHESNHNWPDNSLMTQQLSMSGQLLRKARRWSATKATSILRATAELLMRTDYVLVVVYSRRGEEGHKASRYPQFYVSEPFGAYLSPVLLISFLLNSSLEVRLQSFVSLSRMEHCRQAVVSVTLLAICWARTFCRPLSVQRAQLTSPDNSPVLGFTAPSTSTAAFSSPRQIARPPSCLSLSLLFLLFFVSLCAFAPSSPTSLSSSPFALNPNLALHLHTSATHSQHSASETMGLFTKQSAITSQIGNSPRKKTPLPLFGRR